jgi:hypothetical protein
LLARLEAELAAAEGKSRAMESLAYWAIGSLIALLIIAVFLLLAWRKKANAAKPQDSQSEPKALSVSWPVVCLTAKPTGEPDAGDRHVGFEMQPRAIQLQSAGSESGSLEKQSLAPKSTMSQDIVIADEIRSQYVDEKKQDIADEDHAFDGTGLSGRSGEDWQRISSDRAGLGDPVQ